VTDVGKRANAWVIFTMALHVRAPSHQGIIRNTGFPHASVA
jgi:hypothetical protein